MYIRRKLFSNKEQKRLRRKWDLEQGRGTNYSSGDTHIEAQAQDKILGGKRTEELLEKGKKNSKSEEFLGVKTRKLSAASSQELAEINKAEDLLRAGRERNRDNKFSSLYERDRSKGKKLNELINKGDAGTHKRGLGGKLSENFSFEHDAKEAIIDSKNARLEKEASKKAKEVVENQIKKGLKLSRNQKIAGAAIGTTALIGAGTYAYKKHKNKKE